MSQPISRRSLTKGTAWAAPVALATSTIPAYAASTSTLNYQLTASWFANYRYFTSWSCPSSEGILTGFSFYTNKSYRGASPGFGVIERDGSPATEVTLNGLQLRVAFPVGAIRSITVTGGAYIVSGPVAMSVPGGRESQYDVFTFTYIGVNRGRTASTELASTWPNSQITTRVNYNSNICVPRDLGSYYVSFKGSFTTANGYTKDFADYGWMQTRYM